MVAAAHGGARRADAQPRAVLKGRRGRACARVRPGSHDACVEARDTFPRRGALAVLRREPEEQVAGGAKCASGGRQKEREQHAQQRQRQRRLVRQLRQLRSGCAGRDARVTRLRVARSKKLRPRACAAPTGLTTGDPPRRPPGLASPPVVLLRAAVPTRSALFPSAPRPRGHAARAPGTCMPRRVACRANDAPGARALSWRRELGESRCATQPSLSQQLGRGAAFSAAWPPQRAKTGVRVAGLSSSRARLSRGAERVGRRRAARRNRAKTPRGRVFLRPVLIFVAATIGRDA